MNYKPWIYTLCSSALLQEPVRQRWLPPRILLTQHHLRTYRTMIQSGCLLSVRDRHDYRRCNQWRECLGFPFPAEPDRSPRPCDES